VQLSVRRSNTDWKELGLRPAREDVKFHNMPKKFLPDALRKTVCNDMEKKNLPRPTFCRQPWPNNALSSLPIVTKAPGCLWRDYKNPKTIPLMHCAALIYFALFILRVGYCGGWQRTDGGKIRVTVLLLPGNRFADFLYPVRGFFTTSPWHFYEIYWRILIAAGDIF
jgi:hypothetical protein